MPRKFQGKLHVGRRIQKQKNGDVYVLERTTRYDPATKKTLTVAQRLLGKIVAGTTEMVPTRPKRSRASAQTGATRRHTGLTDILEHVGRVSGIDGDVRRAFPDGGTAEKILTVARYWLATGGQTLPRLPAWQAMHPTPHPGVVSGDVAGDLFKAVGVDEDGIQRYFRLRAARLDPEATVAYDSTTVSTYSGNLHEARRGFNKDGDGLDTIKLLTLYSVRDREPIAFAKQPGNVPDVVSVANALSQLESLGLPKALVVTDNGFCSQANMAEFAARHRKFLTLVDTDETWVRETIDELQDALDGADGVCPFDPGVCGATKVRERHVLGRARRRAGAGREGGGDETIVRRLYVHVFRSPELRAKKEEAFNRRLYEVKTLLERGEELRPSARRFADRYMTVSRTGRGGAAKVAYRNDAVRAARRYFGHFALATNQPMDTFEALRHYRLRERIEEFFGMDKRHFDGRRTRLWSADALRGRQFVQFVGLGYLGRFRRMLDEAAAGLGEPREDTTGERLKLEKNLKNWLAARSTQDLFDWYDCVETTQVRSEAGRYRWSTESVRRDALFLERLGIPPSE
jgi:hypothetical protein